MSIEDYRKYFEILELSPDAQISDVRSSYQRLKTLYSSESIVTEAISYDFSADYKQNILTEIEDAYAKLVEFFENKGKNLEPKDKPVLVFDDDLKKYLTDISSFNGPVLKQVREKLRVELRDISDFTRIRKQYFEDIEHEKFNAFSSEVYLRGYLGEYARYLGLDNAKVTSDYMKRFWAWKAENEMRSKTGAKT